MAVTSDGTPFVEPGDSIAAYPTVSQELAAVIDSLRAMIPAGAIFPYAGKTAPEGYLMCDGKAYNRADFYDLYQVMSDWVGQWGGFPGGNSAQFFVPDFRGRSPIGAASGFGDNPTAPVKDVILGQRPGDWRTATHYHPLFSAGNWGDPGKNSDYAPASLSAPVGPLGGSYPQYVIAMDQPAGTPQPDWWVAGATRENSGRGIGHNIHPSTGVNFIVWTGTTTTGKNPVPGVELAPVTTRMMIEARLQEAGMGEEEIEMLREQLAALKEDTDG